MSDEQSVNYQQEAINRYAEHHGITIIKWYSDIGYSGKDTNRPELQLMLEDLHEGTKVDTLLFYSVDRLGRDLEGNIGTILAITEHIETVVSVSERLTNNAEYFKTFFLLLTSHAQTEREHLLLRMADGRKAKITNRKSFNGSYLPLGYVKGTGGHQERLIPATEENTNDLGAIQSFTALQYIFYQYMEGVSLRKVAENLQRYFGPTYRQSAWTHKSVRYVLGNSAYIGRMQGKLKNNENYYIKDANIEPIIDYLVFQIVQRRLKYERSGRGKTVASRLALYNLCLTCGNSLFRDGQWITCRECNEKVRASEIMQILGGSFSQVLERQGIQNFEEQVEELSRKHEWICRKLQRQLKELEYRYELIQDMSRHEDQAKHAMIEANTRESTNLKKEIEWHETMITMCRKQKVTRKDTRDTPSIPLLFSRRLIRLSYIVLVDLQTKEIEVIFHEDLLKGGNVDAINSSGSNWLRTNIGSNESRSEYTESD